MGDCSPSIILTDSFTGSLGVVSTNDGEAVSISRELFESY
jgi:hypothetical protein